VRHHDGVVAGRAGEATAVTHLLRSFNASRPLLGISAFTPTPYDEGATRCCGRGEAVVDAARGYARTLGAGTCM
jgi:hypothetical protein